MLDDPAENLDSIACVCTPGDACDVCGGGGEIVLRRCPYRTADITASRVCQAVAWAETGFLPHAGGWRQQSATFLQALNVALARKAKLTQPKKPKD